MVKRKRWDKTRPETKALVDRIVHGAFVKEGTMVAFPMEFPGTTLPIPGNESHITSLDAGKDGLIYGGTSGRKVHLFVGMFHGATGIVFDMGVVEGADSCPAICCTEKGFVAALNGEAGGRLVTRNYQPLPFDLLQEWGFSRQPFVDMGVVAPGEEMVDAVADIPGRHVIGTTSNHLCLADPISHDVEVVEEIPGNGRIAVASGGGVIGAADGAHLWRFDLGDRCLDRNWVQLPEGIWEGGAQTWARDPRSGVLYTADGSGRLFSLDEGEGFSSELGRTDLTPVGPMAVTLDGRLFGVCGDGISRMFCYDPPAGEVRDLGVAVSVIQHRRYGYQFAAATVGRDGEIVFGEDDDQGHLWLYFPRIVER